MRVTSLEGELNQAKALQEAVEKDFNRVSGELAAVSAAVMILRSSNLLHRYCEKRCCEKNSCVCVTARSIEEIPCAPLHRKGLSIAIILTPQMLTSSVCMCPLCRFLLQAREQLVSVGSSLDAAKQDLKAAQDSKAALQVRQG